MTGYANISHGGKCYQSATEIKLDDAREQIGIALRTIRTLYGTII